MLYCAFEPCTYSFRIIDQGWAPHRSQRKPQGMAPMKRLKSQALGSKTNRRAVLKSLGKHFALPVLVAHVTERGLLRALPERARGCVFYCVARRFIHQFARVSLSPLSPLSGTTVWTGSTSELLNVNSSVHQPTMEARPSTLAGDLIVAEEPAVEMAFETAQRRKPDCSRGRHGRCAGAGGRH